MLCSFTFVVFNSHKHIHISASYNNINFKNKQVFQTISIHLTCNFENNLYPKKNYLPSNIISYIVMSMIVISEKPGFEPIISFDKTLGSCNIFS